MGLTSMIFRGDLWHVDLSPTRGHEQAGARPCLVLSVDEFNNGPGGLVFIAPLTTKDRGIPFHVSVDPTEVKKTSFIRCDSLRSVSRERLLRKLGSVSEETLCQVEDRIRILLGLY